MRTSETGLGPCLIWTWKHVEAVLSRLGHRNCSLLCSLEGAQAACALVLDGHLGLPALAVRVDVLVAALAAPEKELEAVDELAC